MGDKAGAKKAMADANVEFKAGNYPAAVTLYSQAVELDPGEVTYPANRANVYLKMKSWEEAEKDCDAALKIKPTFAKVGNMTVTSENKKSINKNYYSCI